MAKTLNVTCQETKHAKGNSMALFAIDITDIKINAGTTQRQAKTTIMIQSIEPDIINELRNYVPGETYEITIP